MNKCLPILITINLLLVGLVSNTAYSQSTGASMEEGQCRLIENDAQRLKCFDIHCGIQQIKTDNIEGSIEESIEDSIEITEQNIPTSTLTAEANVAKPLISESAEAVSIPKQNDVVDTNDQQSFGAEQLAKKDTSDSLSEIETTITKIESASDGFRTLHLANGQVWQERENSRIKLSEGMGVEVKKGFFTAYYLSRLDQNSKTLVRRVK